ncbi:hypothetical protein U472_02460 [Orenia metallireducens]|uniref:DUF5698 domain-containing protein n=1 Tax=Orenia metallireducens TaxID=1413210 RepID=A0A1C0ACH1_9FIRM|nr:DUF5698 domain-containing protein [Orenia metallireducens]OCL28080.1 hypothetical protein U472_02460 [Orenia metallireducens]
MDSGNFLARAFDIALGTLRVQIVVSRRKYLAAFIGFFEILIYILIVSKVLQDIGHFINIIAYAGRFSCGTIIGLTIEER